MSTSSADMRS